SPLEPEESVFTGGFRGARWSLGLAGHPDLHLFYAEQPAISKLLVYSYDEHAMLTFVSAVSIDGATLPCWAAISRDGRHLFTANAGNGTVSAFDLSDPRKPRFVDTVRLHRFGNPWGLALDPSGDWLFVVGPRAVR